MIWLIIAVAAGALLLVLLLVLERRFERRSADDAEQELARVKHRLDTMTVELEPPRETGDADDYLQEETEGDRDRRHGFDRAGQGDRQ